MQCFLSSTECDLFFTDEAANNVLSFFPTFYVREKSVNIPVNQTCSFYFGGKVYAQYLGCDGAWNEIPTQSVIDGLDVTPGWSNSRLRIKVSVRG